MLAEGKQTCWMLRVPLIRFVAITLVLLSVVAATLFVLLSVEEKQENVYDLPRTKKEHGSRHRYANVACSSNLCSKVGKDILAKKDGSAVDAAIATLLCIGVVKMHSSGIGGDNFWTIYERQTGKAYTIIARSKAPLASSSTMFVNNKTSSVESGMSVAVPGEVMGLWEAHQRFGRLPWSELFEPSIKLAKRGFPLEADTAKAIQMMVADGTVHKFTNLRNLLTNPATNTWYKTGETVRNPKLARTLRKIANKGAAEFYTGTLADDMVNELQDAGGIITKEDFATYRVHIEDSLRLRLHDTFTVYSSPLPSGGVVMLYILNILSGYNMTADDLASKEKTVLTYHRHLEAFKHAFAVRAKLGSPYVEPLEFVQQMEQIINTVTSVKHGETIRHRISDAKTFPWQEYDPGFDIKEDHGSSQLCVLGPNGDAVSVTSTINLSFGSKLVGAKTGINYNNMMDDFSTPGSSNFYGVKPSPSNYIKPGKRPMSSMSPTIVVDKTGLVKLVIGSAGGTWMITTTAFLTSYALWMEKRVGPTLTLPLIHHQLLPNTALIATTAPGPITRQTQLKHASINKQVQQNVNVENCIHELDPMKRQHCSN